MSSLDVAPESLVGKPLAVTLTLQAESVARCGQLDWLGVYNSSVPTVPGVSLGQWIYLGESYATTPPNAEGTLVLQLVLPPSKLPKHQGNFDVRFHRGNGYGTPELSKQFKLLRRPISMTKRTLVLGMFLIVVALSQNLLNAKGSCPIDPTFLVPGSVTKDPLPPDCIKDHALLLTTSLNQWFIGHPTTARALQALCSASIDLSMLTMLITGAFHRSSTKPFLALFLLMMLRFVAQSAAVMPCAKSFIWPQGAVFGWSVPSLFVDYHPANDYFFSGHTGTILTASLQFFDMDYPYLAWLHLGVLLPFTIGLVVSFRAHRGIDVITGLLAAVAACSLAEKLAEPLDRMLEVAGLNDVQQRGAAVRGEQVYDGRIGMVNGNKKHEE